MLLVPVAVRWFYAEIGMEHVRSLAACYTLLVAPSSRFQRLGPAELNRHMHLVCEKRLLENPVYGNTLARLLQKVGHTNHAAQTDAQTDQACS
jgi:hypothetical protein